MMDRRDFLLAALAVSAAPSVALAKPGRSAATLIAAARRQIGVTVDYDPAYTKLAFPNGDVPRSRGVCTDVVIRAYRDAFGLDLQSLVNADMAAHFSDYPRNWKLTRPDRNIDHRRVPNLRTFFKRAGASLTPGRTGADWRAGDIMTCLVGDSLPHIGIVSDRLARSGNPLVIHNIGHGTQEEDILFAFKLTGRYCWSIA